MDEPFLGFLLLILEKAAQILCDMFICGGFVPIVTDMFELTPARLSRICVTVYYGQMKLLHKFR